MARNRPRRTYAGCRRTKCGQPGTCTADPAAIHRSLSPDRPPMNPEEIHAALSITPLPPPFDLLGESLPHRTAFALLARVAGVPLVALNLSGTEFAERFPKTAIPKEARAEFGADLRRYRAWRSLLLDCLILGSLDQVDQEPWDSVRRVARLSLGKTAANNLYYVSAAIPAGVAARDLTFNIAFAIDQTLGSAKRQGFRAGLRDLDRLHDSAFAVATDLLPISTIGRLPAPAAHTNSCTPATEAGHAPQVGPKADQGGSAVRLAAGELRRPNAGEQRPVA